MTDDVFETRLRSQVSRYADGGVRPIDAYAIAVATLASSHRAGPFGRLEGWRAGRVRLTPRFAMLALLTLIAIAIAVAVVVGGQRSREHLGLVDRPQATAAAIPSTAPADSAPPEAPSVARIAYVQGGDVYVAGHDGSAAVKVLDDPGIEFTNVRWLSDGRHVVVEGAGLYTVVDLTTGEHSRLQIPGDAITAWRAGSDQVAVIQGATRDEPAKLLIIDALLGARVELPADRNLGGLVWSGDGARLGGVSGSDFVRIDTDTGSSTVVATAAGDPVQVAWSTDLERIAFVMDAPPPCDPVADKTCPSAADVYTVDATARAGTSPTKIAGPLPQDQPDGNNHSEPLGPRPMPSWSADGAWIAWRTATGLTIAHPDGTGPREVLKGHVGAYAWDPEGFGINAIMTDAIDGTTGDLVQVDTQTGVTQASRVVGISRVPPTSFGPAIGHAWDIEPPTGSGPATGPAASPGDSPMAPAPTSHRLIAQSWIDPDCGMRAVELDLATGTRRRIASCGVSVAADGRHLVDGHVAIDLIAGTRVPVSGPHESSPSGRWLITPPFQDRRDSTADIDPTWEVATWNGEVRVRIPRPWVNPGYGPYYPWWSPDESVVRVQTEHAAIQVDLTTGEQLTLPDRQGIWASSGHGRRVAYIRDGDAWVANADGSDARNISRFGFGGAEDVWLLPDERTVAVLQGQLMWLIGPDGGRRSIDLGPAADAEAGWRGVSWSPDGRWFAASFHSDQDGILSHTQFFSVDGGELADAKGGDVTWSPDGQHAAVQLSASELDHMHKTAKRSRAKDRVMVVDRAGRVTKVADAWGPSWSPDSTQLAVFASGDIDVLASDGNGRRTVASGLEGVTRLTWIPDR